MQQLERLNMRAKNTTQPMTDAMSDIADLEARAKTMRWWCRGCRTPDGAFACPEHGRRWAQWRQTDGLMPYGRMWAEIEHARHVGIGLVLILVGSLLWGAWRFFRWAPIW